MSRSRHHGTSRIVHIIGILGRVFVGAGVLLLFYTAYLLWGTGVYTHQEQDKGKRALEANPLVSESDIVDGKIPPAKPPHPVAPGTPLFRIKIPKIAAESVVVEGVERDQLNKGPGHFPSCDQVGKGADCVGKTVYPGEHGNVAISGHRTTYGAPFFNLQQLAKGDIIDIISGAARYRYRVREQKITDPVTGYAEVEDQHRDELTLTTCHPRFSASQRLIIHADYIGASQITATTAGQGGGAGKAPSRRVLAPDVLALAAIAIAAALGSLGLSKRYQWYAVYGALLVVGATGLWVGVFPRVLALMPNNY